MTWQQVDLTTDPHELRYAGDPQDIVDALGDLLERRPAWHRQAACRGEGPATWFPGQGGDTEPAREVCAGCPVAEECHAAGSMERFGIWGGMSNRQRKAARRAAA